MTGAERKKLEEELGGLKKQRAEFQAQLAGVAQEGAKYQRAREYWKGRIQQAQKQITEIEANLKAE
jgi:predicted  nucleic acid-binding Zn-ribbon protein